MDEMDQIKQIILELAMTYRDDKITKEHINLWARILSDFSIDEIRICADAYVRDPQNRFFPVPITRLMQYLDGQNDPKDEAKIIADKVIKAISQFGYTNGLEARRHIGEIGWSAATDKYYWGFLCENYNLTIDPTNFYAQLRDSIAAKLAGEKKVRLVGEVRRIEAKEVLKQIPIIIKTMDS